MKEGVDINLDETHLNYMNRPREKGERLDSI